MNIYISLLSLIPSLIIFGIILYSDRKSREPLFFIILCAISGLFTISLSLFLQKHLVNTLNLEYIRNTFSILSFFKILLLSSIEECCKIFLLYIFFSHLKSFDDIYDGFFYSTIIALSFAAIETAMYVFKETTLVDQSSIALVRYFTSIPLHIVCGIVMGYYIALEKFSKKKRFKLLELVKGLTYPIIIHSIYNSILTFIPLFINNNAIVKTIIISYVVIVYIIGLLYINKIKFLNEKFLKNRKYPEKYKFLMHKRQYKKIIEENN